MDNHIFRDKFHSTKVKGRFLFVEAEAVGTKVEAVDEIAASKSQVAIKGVTGGAISLVGSKPPFSNRLDWKLCLKFADMSMK